MTHTKPQDYRATLWHTPSGSLSGRDNKLGLSLLRPIVSIIAGGAKSRAAAGQVGPTPAVLARGSAATDSEHATGAG